MVSHHGSDSGRDGRRLAGASLWAGIDAQRGYHHQPFYGGALDLFRLPKFSHYLFQSQRPPHVHVPGLDDGPMVFIANYATFLSPTAVTVFSNCDEVRLFQAGEEVGRMQATIAPGNVRQPFTFCVDTFAPLQSTMYMTGVARAGEAMRELRAEGLIDGKVVAMHVVHPPGVAAALALEADLCGVDLTADDADWVRVYASVCDARGTVCPFADDMIQFEVEGEGTIIGGAAIGANPARAEAGIATALVRATSRPGRIHVTASAFGLAPARIELVSHSQAGSLLSARYVRMPGSGSRRRTGGAPTVQQAAGEKR
jgi:beta-galactosidase